MFVTGLTIIKNGVKLKYPFLESIQSLLPICDEFIAVVGDCEDDTRDKILSLNSPKIKIIDTIWDPTLREGGKILAQQTNIGIDAAKGDWIFYMQADDMVHEKDLPEIYAEMKACLNDPEIEGLLFPYHHFWTYDYITIGRSYRREIRIVRNIPGLRSYRDAQGFRKYPDIATYEKGHSGFKLRTKLIRPHVFAYGRVRPPKEENEKIREFVRYWQSDEEIAKRFENQDAFDYEKVDRIMPFPAIGHPALMAERIRLNTFHVKPKQGHFSFRKRLKHWVERITGRRIGEYKNYVIVQENK